MTCRTQDYTVSHAIRRRTANIARATVALAARYASAQHATAIDAQLRVQIRKELDGLQRLMPNESPTRAAFREVIFTTGYLLNPSCVAWKGRELLRRQRAAILTLRCLTHDDSTPTWVVSFDRSFGRR